MKILAIGAHFDDVELGCGGTLARYKREGHTVDVYVATRSGYSSFDNTKIRDSNEASQEAIEAIKILGSGGINLHRGEFETFNLKYQDKLNTTIRQIIDTVKADTIFSVGSFDALSDHWALAKSVLHASRHVPRVAFYRCNWYPSEVSFNGRLYVDISDFIELKQSAIKAYSSEWTRAGYRWSEYFTNLARNDGMVVGVNYAECFEVIRWLTT